MKTLKVIEKRHSVRDYNQKILSNGMMKKVEEMVTNYPKITGYTKVEFELFKNGDVVFEKLDGIAGYNGVMIEAPHYIGIYSDMSLDGNKLAGYIGEWISLELAKIDLGTCWIECVEKSKEAMEALNLSGDKKLVAMISLGKPLDNRRLSSIYNKDSSGGHPLEKMGYPYIDIEYVTEPRQSRKSIIEIVSHKEFGNKFELDELEKRGLEEVFFYMRLAPSWANRQPWNFIINGDEIILVVEDDSSITDEVLMLDAGVAMLYFEVAMHGVGLPGSWKLDAVSDIEKYKIPKEYLYVGCYNYK